jgi:hypothetical protein
MSFSAATAGNFQFFPSLVGGCQKALRQSAAVAGNSQFFPSLGSGDLKILKFFQSSAAAAQPLGLHL